MTEKEKHHDQVKRAIEAGTIPPMGVMCFVPNKKLAHEKVTLADEAAVGTFEGASAWKWQDVIAPQEDVIRYDWWNMKYYGITLDSALMDKIMSNFSEETNDIPWNLGHSWEPDSFGWTRALRKQGEKIQGETSYLSDTIPLIKAGKYLYASAELSYASVEEATAQDEAASHMTGIALVNSPAIRSMNEVSLKLGMGQMFSQGNPDAKTRTQIVNELETEEDDMADKTDLQKEIDALKEEKAKLLERVKKAESENVSTKADVAFSEHLDRGATSPANIEAYKEVLSESPTPEHDLEIYLSVLKGNPDNSVVDLSKNISEQDKKPADEGSGGENLDDAEAEARETFIHKRTKELTDEGKAEYPALKQAEAEYIEQEAEKEDENDE